MSLGYFAKKRFCPLGVLFLLFTISTSGFQRPIVAQRGTAQSLTTPPSVSSVEQMRLVGSEQGMSSRALTSAAQDSDGFLWFGTENGLNRYDGISTMVFSAIAGDTTTIPDNAITHLHTDKRGRLWIATKSGLALWDAAALRFRTFLRGKPIADITEDSRGMLWLTLRGVGTKSGALCAFYPETATVRIFEESQNGLRSAYLYDVFEDSRQRLWLGTANGLYRYDYTKAVWTAFLTDNTTSGTLAKALRSHVHAIGEAYGTVWIGTEQGLARITDADKGTVEWFATECGVLALHCDAEHQLWAAIIQAGTVANALKFVRVRDITDGLQATVASDGGAPVVLLEGKLQRHRMATDRDGTLWWGIGNGVIAFSPKNATTRLMLADAKSPTRIKTPVVSVVVDRLSSKPFFARMNMGVVSFATTRSAAFRHIGAEQNGEMISSPITLLSSSVSALYEAPDGALWIGYRNGSGMSRYDRKKGIITHFRQDPSNPASVSGAGGETTIGAFLHDKGEQLWVGAYQLDRWDAASERVTHFQAVPGQNVPITALLEDRSGRLWVGTKVGLSALERPKEGSVTKTERFVNKSHDTKSLGNNCINVLHEDENGQLWVGHDRGLDCFDPATRQFYHLMTDTITGSLFTMAVTSLHNDGSTLWVGTQSGLYTVNKATKSVISSFTTHQGFSPVLPDNHVAAVLSDLKGNLWVSTPRGLLRSINGDSYRIYNLNDGLADVEFLDRAAVRTRDGMLWFGSASGLTVFHPDSLVPNPHPPVVVLTGLQKFGVPAVLAKTLSEMAAGQGATEFRDALELGYDDKVVSFQYAALDFVDDAAKVHYAYKLEGFDTDWIHAGAQREAKYTSLPAGAYIFSVRAANSDGVWSKTVRLTVIVSPPWWRTWWFLLASGFVSIIVLWLVYKWRVRSIEHRGMELERLVEERTHLLQEANVEVGRQLEILNEQAREIEITNARLQDTNLQLDHTLTELKGTQAQLVQSERLNAAGMLTAGVMHEINNPNASVFSALELVEQRLYSLQDHFLSVLDERDRTSQEATRFVGMIAGTKDIVNVALNGSERIKNIVAALQGFTKHQHDGMTKNSLAGEIHTTVTMFRYQFKDIDVEENIPTDWRIEGAWAELNQAMLNLLVNAAQAEATTIAIIADSVRNGTITLRISDNGMGMSSEIQARVFEPFYTTKSAVNSGLGLSITKKIIEQHGGSIAVESRVGEGTTFWLTLPA